MEAEGQEISLGMGVCGSGDKKVICGEVVIDAGSPEIESPSVILNQRMELLVNAAGYLEAKKAHNLFEID